MRALLVLILSFAILSTGLSFLSWRMASAATIDASKASKICRMSDLDGLASCDAGTVIVFTPDRWGNAQLPVMFAAHACDLRHQVVWTEGAVTCLRRPSAHHIPPALPAS